MNDKQIKILAGVCALGALYLFWRTSQVKAAPAGAGSNAMVREVTPANSNGWRYFSDGTAIDPGGNHYFQGELKWTAPMSADESTIGPPGL